MLHGWCIRTDEQVRPCPAGTTGQVLGGDTAPGIRNKASGQPCTPDATRVTRGNRETFSLCDHHPDGEGSAKGSRLRRKRITSPLKREHPVECAPGTHSAPALRGGDRRRVRHPTDREAGRTGGPELGADRDSTRPPPRESVAHGRAGPPGSTPERLGETFSFTSGRVVGPVRWNQYRHREVSVTGTCFSHVSPWPVSMCPLYGSEDYPLPLPVTQGPRHACPSEYTHAPRKNQGAEKECSIPLPGQKDRDIPGARRPFGGQFRSLHTEGDYRSRRPLSSSEPLKCESKTF